MPVIQTFAASTIMSSQSLLTPGSAVDWCVHGKETEAALH